MKQAVKSSALVHSLLLASLTVAVAPIAYCADPGSDYAARVDRVLAATPLIDGHNDLLWEIRTRFKSDLSKFAFDSDTSKLPTPPNEAKLMTDIPRLRVGRVGGQFWSVWIPVDIKGPEAVQVTLEQIDLTKRLVARYPNDLAMASTAAEIRRLHKAGKIASLIGVEGGHQINNSLAVLRQYYDLGARYMTLTHTSNTAWADSATDAPVHHGLTAFGKEVVREMNRMGMLVDLAHVSADTMRAALEVSAAPVIFSHSSARALVDHPRDVPDDVLLLVAKNDGVVMVNFYPGFVSATRRQWEADRAGVQTSYSGLPDGLYLGQPDRARAALAEWDAAHPEPVVTIADVANHFDHIRKVASVDHVGIGSDFDGIPKTPADLDGVDKYPALLIELARRGWSDADLAKVVGGNLLRVMARAEEVSKQLRASRTPSAATIEQLDGQDIAPK
jgi:membrane dipeptidase